MRNETRLTMKVGSSGGGFNLLSTQCTRKLNPENRQGWLIQQINAFIFGILALTTHPMEREWFVRLPLAP